MLVLALLTGLALSGRRAGESELDRLIARTDALASFTARYSVTTTPTDATSKQDVPQTLRIDYAAPGRVRVESQLTSGLMSYTCVDGVYTVVASGAEPVHARVDYAAVRTRVADVERKVAEFVPLVARDVRAPGAGVGMRWWFDDKAQRANYQVEAVWSDERRDVLGWLATLRAKKAELTPSGEQLTFTTDDGAFRGALSAKSGFLEDLWGKSPKGEVHVHLEQLEIGGGADPARFGGPDATPAGRDASAELLRNCIGLATRELRSRIYRTLASAPGEPWEGEARTKIESALRVFHEVAVGETLAAWREDAVAKRDGVAERLRKLAQTQGAAEVAAVREREIGYLNKALDDLDAGFAKRLLAPDSDAPLPRAEELLALEHEVVARVFDENVRRPVVADFERATEPAKN